MLDTYTFRGKKFRSNFGIVKKFGAEKYKLTHMRVCRERGLIDVAKYTKKGTKNAAKLDNNISRARSAVYELAACNEWDLFVTFTLDKEKYDRYSLPKFRKDMAQFVRDKRKKYGAKITYLLIPERHKDGAWHMHGFMTGVPDEALRAFTLQERLPRKIRARLKAGKAVYTWEEYARKFGFADIERIENREAAAKYITKYVTEDLTRSVTECGAHTYYASQGLKRAEVIQCGNMRRAAEKYAFENDFVRIAWADNAEAFAPLFA